jgi:glucokinase-like ROK family protein
VQILTSLATAPTDQVESLVSVLDAVRIIGATTRPEIAKVTGLGRNVVAQRATQLVDAGLLAEGELGRSTGGRAPRQLRFVAEAGTLLLAELGATSISVAASDLGGRFLVEYEEPADITRGPETILDRVSDLFQQMLSKLADTAEVWGIGIGLPGPVEFEAGTPVAPPIMPGWDRYDVRQHFRKAFNAPVWVDNDVNLMALGEVRGGGIPHQRDVIYIKVGSGIGAGLVSQGRLHRGAQGCAGDIGHIAVVDRSDILCRCGQMGCLEAMAGGFALARDGQRAAEAGTSRPLADLLAHQEHITAESVIWAAERGDQVAVDLLVNSARLVGESLARLVNFFNPSIIFIGGGVASAGDLYLAKIRQTIFARSLPLATRSLSILPSPLADRSGLRGAAFMVLDELFSTTHISGSQDRSSDGQPQLTG